MKEGRKLEYVIGINKAFSVEQVFMDIIPAGTISAIDGHFRKTRVERRGGRCLAADYGVLKGDSCIDMLPVRSLVIRPFGHYIIRV